MPNHPNRGRRGLVKRQWEAAAAASSLLYHSMDASTATHAAWALEGAARNLRLAGLADLAETADELASDFCASDESVRALLSLVAAEAGRLEALYLGDGE